MHRNDRRSVTHDYCAPGFYMITATAVKPYEHILSRIPQSYLSKIARGEMIIPILTSLGQAVKAEIQSIPSYHPELKIVRFVIMPDHIHFVVEVKERLKRKLGWTLSGFFGACSKHQQQLYHLESLEPFFQPFHDRIIRDYAHLNKAIKYVEANPAHYLIKHIHSNLFKRYLHINIGEREYAAYGNIFLLRDFDIVPVRIHRYWTDVEFAAYEEKCIRALEGGAVVISPFIHPAENAIRRKAIEMGNKIIHIRANGFEERFTPQGEDFQLCAEGRLLLLAAWPEKIGRKSDAGATEFHMMNSMAQEIADMPAGERLYFSPR